MIFTDCAWLSSLVEYLESTPLKTIEAAERAAAASAAASVPGDSEVILKRVRDVSMSSGRSQHWWSELPSPTYDDEKPISMRK